MKLVTTEVNMFAVKYLEILSACAVEIQNQVILYSPKTLKNLVLPKIKHIDSEGIADIIKGSIEEYENMFEIDLGDYSITIESSDLFQDYMIDLGKSPEENFESVMLRLVGSQTDLELFIEYYEDGTTEFPEIFLSVYLTCIETAIASKYHKQYEVLKEEYPGLPYYPPFDLYPQESEYYESSTCY